MCGHHLQDAESTRHLTLYLHYNTWKDNLSFTNWETGFKKLRKNFQDSAAR
jgi:hypothetical protein